MSAVATAFAVVDAVIVVLELTLNDKIWVIRLRNRS
jgi:hypothetical protein